MNARNANNAASRRAVTERLRQFFSYLTTQLATGTAKIWAKVERRLADKSPDERPERDVPPLPGLPHGSMQQPVQQQQSKAKPEDEK